MRTFLGNSDSVYVVPVHCTCCKFSHRRVPPTLSIPKSSIRASRYISRNLSNVSTETFIQLRARGALFILLIRPAWKYVFSIWPRSFSRARLHNTTTRTCDFFLPFRPCDVVSRKKGGEGERERENAIRINRQRRGQMVVDRGRDENEMGRIIPWGLDDGPTDTRLVLEPIPSRICFWLTSQRDLYPGRNPTDILPVCRLFPHRRAARSPLLSTRLPTIDNDTA